MVDQYSFDLVREITRRTSKAPVVDFYAVRSLTLVGGSLSADMSAVKTLPTKIEERIFSAINCTGEDKTETQHFKSETTRSVTTELEKTITADNELKVDVSFGPEALRFNADLVRKEGFSLTSKVAQVREEKIFIEKDETRTVPAKTHVLYKLLVSKGLASVPVSGFVVIDAVVDIAIKIVGGSSFLNGTVLKVTRTLSDSQFFDVEPKNRTVEFKGMIYGEGYERTDIVYNQKPIPDPDKYPPCKFPELLAEFGYTVTTQGGVVSFAGDIIELPHA